MKLSLAERWILANQYRLMQELQEKKIPFYENAIAILEGGYEDHYDLAAKYLKEEAFPSNIAIEVRDILSMFSHMSWAREKFEGDPLVKSPLFEFWGFDGNNSPEHGSYARLLHQLGECRDLGDLLLADSHIDTIETYRSMVRAWKALPRKGLQMTKDDVQAIMDAPVVENLPMPEGFDA